jgi:hypothetical protein
MRSWVIGVLLIVGAAGTRAEPLAVKRLSDFRADGGLSGWELRQVEAEQLPGEGLRFRYPAWMAGRGKWPAMVLDFGNGGFDEEDWSRYDRLVFEVANESAGVAQLKLRLDDRAGKQGVHLFAIPPGQSHRCQVDIAVLGESINSSQVVHFDLFMSQPGADYDFTIAEIRLEADALDVEEMELRRDPFGEGLIEVEARLRRVGFCEVKVLQGEEVIARYEESTSRLEWKWKGSAPGEYRVELSVTDQAWSSEPAVQELGKFKILPEEERPNFVAWTEPTTRKVMLHSWPEAEREFFSREQIAVGGVAPIRIDMGRNEREGAQVVWLVCRDSTRLRFAVEELRHVETGIDFPAEGTEIHQVGYVFTKEPESYTVDFSGWWPDPLLPVVEMEAVPGECMPVWVSLKSRVNTAPGIYRGKLGIWKDGEREGEWPLEVRVYDASVPDSSSVRTAFSLYDGMLEQVYDGRVPRQLYRKYQHFIAAHRLNVDHLYRSTPPRITDLRYFDRRGQLNAFNVLYLNAGRDYSRKGLAKLAAELDPYVEELRALGLIEKAYFYGFDEVNADRFDEMRLAFGFLKGRYPEIQTATTARDPSLGLATGLDEVVDIWVPLTAAYDPLAAGAARERGDEVWWYICIGPRHPYANWFIEYPAVEARLLWWMTYRQRADGFLYYAMNRWPNQKEPMRLDGNNKTNWNPASFKTANGDGCLFYAGPNGPISTVRLENVRDGLEDYEMLRLLGAEEADELCDRMISSPREFRGDVEGFGRVRRALLERLEGLSAERKQ